ncbi:MAG TPA: Ig-like domain-containing protein, partial [Thermoplasmata archaeon]|nr:Ig-like domain-containing protein [Thermoplasmata archaeon]
NLSSTEHAPGSNRSLECRFAVAATKCVGGGPARHLFTEQDAVFLDYWVKYSNNWVGSGKSYHPHEFHFISNKDPAYVGPAGTHLTMYVEEVGGRPRLALQDLKNVDKNCVLRNDNSFVGCNGNHSTYPFTENRSVASCNLLLGDLDGRDCFQTGSDWYSARFWDAPQGTKLNDDRWHNIRVLFQLNSISGGKGVIDGKMRYWLDGNLTLSYDKILYRTGVNFDLRYNQFLIAPYIGDGSPVDQTMWIDDLRVEKVSGNASNTAPQVSAGVDQTITLPASATLDGTATDDGLPDPPAKLTMAWSKVSGPGTVTFADPTAVDTTATFSAAGAYVLRLEGDDGALKSSDDTSIDVKPASGANATPQVNAGADLTVSLPAQATLDGSATDDGLPDPPAKLAISWSKVSGPGSVTFADPTSAKTTATFGSAGSYVLKLEADDSALNASDEVTMDVEPPTGQDAKPTIAILSPTAGSTVSKQVTIAVQAQDDVKVAKVSLLVDEIELKGFTAPPYSVVWDSTLVKDGDHLVKAIATDSAGQSAETAVSVKVSNGGGGGQPGGGSGGLFGGSMGLVLLAVIVVLAAAFVVAAILFSRRKRQPTRSGPDWGTGLSSDERAQRSPDGAWTDR